jgi:hypothetical protein
MICQIVMELLVRLRQLQIILQVRFSRFEKNITFPFNQKKNFNKLSCKVKLVRLIIRLVLAILECLTRKITISMCKLLIIKIIFFS